MESVLKLSRVEGLFMRFEAGPGGFREFDRCLATFLGSK
jgi:hypothetical protein